MALELLAGPFDVTYNGAITGYNVRPTWTDPEGLVGFLTDGGTAKYQIVQLDGVTHVRNNDASAFKAQSLSWDFVQDAPLYFGFGGSGIYEFDALTGSIGALITGGYAGYPVARMADRWLAAQGNNFNAVHIYWFPLNNPAAQPTIEATLLAGRTLSGAGIISDAGGGKLYAGFTNGDIYCYDHAGRAQVGPWQSINLTNKGIWYSRKWDIFISLHYVGANHDQIRIWANETRPAVLSNPTALSSVLRGKVTTLRVQLLGDAGEPAPNELVDWALSGPGALSTLQGATDADGFATVDYIAPTGSLGSFTLGATAKY